MTRTLILFLMAAAGRSQLTSGGILGDVTDPSGSAVPGAAVTVSSVLTGNERIVISDGAGHYAMTNLPPASYVTSVEFGEPYSPAHPGMMGTRCESTPYKPHNRALEAQ